VFDIDDQEYRFIGVLSKHFVDLNVVGPEGVAGRVPSDKLFLLTDLHYTPFTFLIMSNID
jgi:hypothetical protein